MAMITKKVVQSQLASSVSNLIKDEGFILNKTDNTIIRKKNHGFELISIRIIDYWPLSINIEQINLSIRYDKVENIVNDFYSEDMFNKKFSKYTSTIVNSITFSISDSEIKDIIIKDYNDLKKGVEKIIKHVLLEGIPFFKQFKTIEDASNYKKNGILNDKTKISYNLRNLMQSLTLMRLINDKDFYYLCEKYKELYVPFEGEEITGRKAMDDLIQFLKEM